eukprot:15479260-Alexandrium_andersonii.AAC.1
MLEVLCEGVSYTDRMYNFFVRFSDRTTGEAFRSMLEEQVQFVEECVRESGNIALLERAATAIT